MTQVPPSVSAWIDRVAPLVSKLRRVPDSARVFDTTAGFAATRYRLPQPLLAAMLACGLPSRDDGTRFDQADLRAVALHMGTGSLSHTLRVFLPRTLASTSRRRGEYRVSYMPACPDPGHAAPCRYAVRLPAAEAIRETAPSSVEPLLRVTVPFNDALPELPPPARELTEEVAGYDFAPLPDAVSTDTAVMARTGLADCLGVSYLLAKESPRRGLTARRSYGLLVSPPFATTHYWTEFRVDGRWVPVDPVLVATMVRWRVLDADTWGPSRSLGSVFWRLSETYITHSTHNGVDVAAPFAAQLLAVR